MSWIYWWKMGTTTRAVAATIHRYVTTDLKLSHRVLDERSIKISEEEKDVFSEAIDKLVMTGEMIIVSERDAVLGNLTST